MIYLIIFLILATALISWAWIQGIDFMKENYPNYNGEDFLNLDNEEKKDSKWDDNKIHTEGGF